MIRREGEGFRVRLPAEERDALRALPDQLRALVESGDREDPAVARLFPDAVPDDPEAERDFRRVAGEGLVNDRLRATELWESTLDHEQLSEDELLAWLGAVNDVRLVLGTRLDVSEESTDADFAGDEERASAFELYRYLSWLVTEIVEALDER